MPAALAASIVDLLLGLKLGAIEHDAGNRFSLDGLTLDAGQDGAREVGIRRLEATSLRMGSGPWVLEIGRLALHKLVGQVRVDRTGARLAALQAAEAELSGLAVHGPLILSPPRKGDPHAVHAHGSADITAGQPAAAAWCLGPLAAAEGTLRAEIVDAHLLFDADVTVPLRQGQVDFNQATVEHVGPDSRMGVSRMGLYVDAPNGRSYLYQFPSSPVAGVEFERRGAFLGTRVSDRGRLRLQPFGEGLLRQGRVRHGLGFTEQARLLFDRTALFGELQLGDGKLAGPGVQAEMVGRAEGRNLVQVRSEAVGRGITLEMPALALRQAVLDAGALRLGCDELTGTLLLRCFVERSQLRVDLTLASVKISGLHLDLANRGHP